MDIQSNISNNIKKCRKALGLSQEALADELGVTSQAVSKWECMQSIPDIEMMVTLCTFFGISMDKLILDKDPETIVIEEKTENEMAEEDTDNIKNEEHYDRRGLFNKIYFDALPDDDNLRVLQFKGKKLLREDTYDPEIFIPLAIECGESINVHVVGSAHLEGNVGGDLHATNATCDMVAGNVNGVSIECDDVAGDVSATGVNCNDVAGDISTVSINCNEAITIKNCVSVTCDSVVTIEHCERDIVCDNVDTIVRCQGNITCDDIDTVENCNGDIHCDKVGKIEKCGGTVYVG